MIPSSDDSPSVPYARFVACPEVRLCLDCLAPQEGHLWFCPQCGAPSGEYVNTMPYLYLFSMGEGFRRGVTGPPEKRPAINAGLLLAATTQYAVFAPLYWFWMYRKAQGKPLDRRDL